MSATEIISAIANAATAGATGFAAWYAYKSLHAWRAESVGTRKAEVAEEVLTSFYRMQEVIFDARAPMVWAPELVADDGTTEVPATDASYNRLMKERAFIAEWRASKHRFFALFGRSGEKSYQEIESVIAEIRASAMVLRGHVARDAGERADQTKWRRIVLRETPFGEVDPTTKRIDDAVAEIEKICRPVIAHEAIV